MRLTQLVLPGMRRQGAGRIVNVSSMGGRFTLPGARYYHATKHALESISDALRFELRPFGISTSWSSSRASSGRVTPRPRRATVQADSPGPYAGYAAAIAERTRQGYAGPLARLAGAGPERVASVIAEALGAERPRTRYPVTASARVLMASRRGLPDRVWDALLRREFPAPGGPRP